MARLHTRGPAGAAAPADRLPPRVLPLLYLGTAHAALVLACVCAAAWPQAIAGFFYHPWMAALVHMVTLGWITMSILGVLYIIAPLGLRMALPAQRGDYWAYAGVVIGLIGLVSHFWIQEFSGMAWSAGTATAGVLYVMVRVLANIRRSAAHRAVKLHVALAAANLLGAALLGTLLGFDKVYHFLPGFVLTNVFAHAHLAAIGWATMMVVGVGYHMLPMVLPAEMPRRTSLYASAILLEAGVAGLFVGLLLQSAWARLGGVLIVCGLASFAGHVIVMLGQPKPRSVRTATPDFAVWHVGSAGVCLVAAACLGLVLLFAPPSEWRLQVAVVYGLVGLVGFLAQMILGMEMRILPMYASYWTHANVDYAGDVVPPQEMGSQRLRATVFTLWTAGLAILAIGFYTTNVRLIGTGAWCLLGAAATATLHTARVVSHAFRRGT